MTGILTLAFVGPRLASERNKKLRTRPKGISHDLARPLTTALVYPPHRLFPLEQVDNLHKVDVATAVVDILWGEVGTLGLPQL